MRKILGIITLLCIILPVISACGVIETETQSDTIDKVEVYAHFGSTNIPVVQMNSSPKGDNVVLYNRDYKNNDGFVFAMPETQEGRIGISVRRIENEGNVEYDIVDRVDSVKGAPIPTNGFVLSIPSAMLDGVRANKGQFVKIDGYDTLMPEFERNDLASMSPDYLLSTATRRINYINPVGDLESDKIYYIDKAFDGEKEIDFDNRVVTVSKNANYSSKIISIEAKKSISSPSKDNAYFVFTGEYNCDYVDFYLTSAERISYSMLDKANGYSDVPAVVTKSGVIKFIDEVYNVESIDKDGIYVFDNSFTAAVTPVSTIERIDVVVVDGYVAQIADKNARSLIPDGNGFALSLVGTEALKRISDFSIGEKLETFYIDFCNLPEMYAEINNHIIEISHVDGARTPEGVAVLYTSLYGATTQTNQYGTEIVIVDGKVSEKRSSGNSSIPKDGYVLSVHKDHPTYSYLKKIEIGDSVDFSLSGSDYSVTVLNFNAINQTRLEDMLIVYRNKGSSGANEFGYEIAVDKDGYAVEDGYGGNITIPKGGFALSGHGINKVALEKVYAVGQKIIVDDKEKTVTFIKTPYQKIQTAEKNFAVVSDKLQAAKKAFLSLDYKGLDAQFSLLSELLSKAENLFEQYEFEQALQTAESVVATCDNLKYSLIESKAVQNRAVWHRSFEKNDEQVRATVEKMKLLNVNAVYLETWYEGYCLGAKVDVDGITTPPANAGYDALEGFVRICHEYGIEVHSWVHNFFVGYYYDNGNEYYNPLFKQYKDKYLLDIKGRDFFYYSANNNKFIFLNSNDRECRDLILEIYGQLVSKYDIDGLHLDYIRYPELNYGTDDFGYNQDIIDDFSAQTGIKGDPRTFLKGSSNEKAWIRFRCDIITDWMREVYELVRETKPALWLSAATYPDIELSKNTIAQDVSSFVERGYLDEIFSMSYGIDTPTVLASVNDYVAVTKNEVFYSAGIAAFLETTKENFAYQLTDVEHNGADGVSIFSLGSINPEKYQMQITNGAFRDASAQTYALSNTVSAQMDFIIKKSDNLSCILEELDDEQLEFIKSKCVELKALAATFDYKNASVTEKIDFCKKTVSEIEKAAFDIEKRCGDNKETKTFIEDLEDLKYWLTLTENRLNTRR